ncbi:MAG: Glutathione S-transferase GST-6.0 [Steroidobacteraceae bacterium]|nr:Glutathione S-transferase GST-6.0 [Steroidobacteraceae bacterium]
MKLYYSPGACSQAPHIAAHELGLPVETVKVDLRTHTLADGSDYYKVNPKGYVPLLVLADGTTLTEANVVLQYLADQKPGTLAPKFGTLERWKLTEMLAFLATEVHKGFSALWNPRTPAEVRAAAVERLGTRFALLSQTLAKQPFLMGDKFTIADAYFFVLLNWTNIHKVDLTPWPALKDYQARVAARPAVQATLKAEGLVK